MCVRHLANGTQRQHVPVGWVEPVRGHHVVCISTSHRLSMWWVAYTCVNAGKVWISHHCVQFSATNKPHLILEDGWHFCHVFAQHNVFHFQYLNHFYNLQVFFQLLHRLLSFSDSLFAKGVQVVLSIKLVKCRRVLHFCKSENCWWRTNKTCTT